MNLPGDIDDTKPAHESAFGDDFYKNQQPEQSTSKKASAIVSTTPSLYVDWSVDSVTEGGLFSSAEPSTMPHVDAANHTYSYSALKFDSEEKLDLSASHISLISRVWAYVTTGAEWISKTQVSEELRKYYNFCLPSKPGISVPKYALNIEELGKISEAASRLTGLAILTDSKKKAYEALQFKTKESYLKHSLNLIDVCGIHCFKMLSEEINKDKPDQELISNLRDELQFYKKNKTYHLDELAKIVKVQDEIFFTKDWEQYEPIAAGKPHQWSSVPANVSVLQKGINVASTAWMMVFGRHMGQRVTEEQIQALNQSVIERNLLNSDSKKDDSSSQMHTTDLKKYLAGLSAKYQDCFFSTIFLQPKLGEYVEYSAKSVKLLMEGSQQQNGVSCGLKKSFDEKLIHCPKAVLLVPIPFGQNSAIEREHMNYLAIRKVAGKYIIKFTDPKGVVAEGVRPVLEYFIKAFHPCEVLYSTEEQQTDCHSCGWLTMSNMGKEMTGHPCPLNSKEGFAFYTEGIVSYKKYLEDYGKLAKDILGWDNFKVSQSCNVASNEVPVCDNDLTNTNHPRLAFLRDEKIFNDRVSALGNHDQQPENALWSRICELVLTGPVDSKTVDDLRGLFESDIKSQELGVSLRDELSRHVLELETKLKNLDTQELKDRIKYLNKTIYALNIALLPKTYLYFFSDSSKIDKGVPSAETPLLKIEIKRIFWQDSKSLEDKLDIITRYIGNEEAYLNKLEGLISKYEHPSNTPQEEQKEAESASASPGLGDDDNSFTIKALIPFLKVRAQELKVSIGILKVFAIEEPSDINEFSKLDVLQQANFLSDFRSLLNNLNDKLQTARNYFKDLEKKSSESSVSKSKSETSVENSQGNRSNLMQKVQKQQQKVQMLQDTINFLNARYEALIKNMKSPDQSKLFSQASRSTLFE